MSSIIGYRKEFEDIILKGNYEEALKTLVPNSSEQIYLKFCEEYKKCCSEKKITAELDKIIGNAKINHLSYELIKVLETKRDLLEYYLPSTPQEKKNKIIEELYRNYCGVNLNYDAPFFARGNKEQYGAETETKNNTPLELTEKIIKKAVDSDIRKNERNKTYKILNAPEKKRPKLFLEYIDSDQNLCMDIIYSRIKIPFYLMTKEEFSKIIQLFNQATQNLNFFDLSLFTIEQIERLIKETYNKQYVNKQNLLFYLMNKKYNILLKKAKKENNLEKLKKILWEVYHIFKENYKPNLPGVLLYILKINKQQNILDIKPLIKYLEYPILDSSNYEQINFYKNKIK